MHVSKKMSPFFLSDILLVMYRYPKYVHTLCENVITKLPTTKDLFSMVFWLLVSQTQINMNLMIYCEFFQFGLWRVKHCVWSLGESELIKYIKFWNCGSSEKLSIVITSLYNTSQKWVLLASIKKWISFSTQSSVQCLQLVVALGVGISLFQFSVDGIQFQNFHSDFLKWLIAMMNK